MIHSSFTPPSIDQATIDAHIARAQRARARAVRGLFTGLFRGS